MNFYEKVFDFIFFLFGFVINIIFPHRYMLSQFCTNLRKPTLFVEMTNIFLGVAKFTETSQNLGSCLPVQGSKHHANILLKFAKREAIRKDIISTIGLSSILCYPFAEYMVYHLWMDILYTLSYTIYSLEFPVDRLTTMFLKCILRYHTSTYE